MRILYHIIKKEFIQIFRNKAILPIMLIAPIAQLIVLSYAADNEVRNVNLAILDQNHSTYSQRLIHKIEVSSRFILVDVPNSAEQADELLQKGSVDVVLTIPPFFETEFDRDKSAELQLLVNAINGQQASMGAAYLSTIVQSFNTELREEVIPVMLSTQRSIISKIDIQNSYWYNPDLNYKYFMIPGIMGELVTILVMLLTAMNIVREKEIGTIEQINVTPIKKWQFILGKMIPFLIIGLAILTVGLTLGKFIFDVPIRGNLAVVFLYCVFNIAAVLGLGLFISNISSTQQQAMFTTFFFVIIFILMSGLFTPIESMPKWAQYMTIPNPIAHFVHVMRSVLLKASGFTDVAYNFKATFVLAVLFNTMAILSYKKTN
jgi:ABC-2 type transport system permease protein